VTAPGLREALILGVALQNYASKIFQFAGIGIHHAPKVVEYEKQVKIRNLLVVAGLDAVDTMKRLGNP